MSVVAEPVVVTNPETLNRTSTLGRGFPLSVEPLLSRSAASRPDCWQQAGSMSASLEFQRPLFLPESVKDAVERGIEGAGSGRKVARNGVACLASALPVLSTAMLKA